MTATAATLDRHADPAQFVAAYRDRARRFETRAKGLVVWHSWGSGPPLLLLHGSHGSWTHWIANIDALSASHTLWIPDIPGYGESADPVSRDQESVATPIAEGLIELIGDNSPADVMGFSFGGVTGAYIAAIYPQLVRRLILIGSGGLDIPLTGTFDLKRVAGLEGDALNEAHRHNLLAIMLHSPDSIRDLELHLQNANRLLGRLRPDTLIMPDKLLAVLPRISAQIDAIWGEHDAPHPPETHIAALRQHQPDLEGIVIAGAGHWAMYERAEAFNAAATRMLAQPLR